jgi:glycosyltransferase involved in cell wall biosynthesis
MTSIRRALEAWTWVASPLGESYPLVLLGLSEKNQHEAEVLADSLRVLDTIVALPPIRPGWVASLYRRAAVVFHPAEISPWGGSIHHALACGKPIVAAETARTSAMVGPAAILVASSDTRRLGASVIGVVVKEALTTQLEKAAQERASSWVDVDWGTRLMEAYQQVLANP